MALDKVILELLCIMLIDALIINNNNNEYNNLNSDINKTDTNDDDKKLSDVFNGVYTECFVHLSYTCLQRKTLLYLKELNKLDEVSVIGDYVKFVKLNTTEGDDRALENMVDESNAEELSSLIDAAIDKFFNNHIMKFSAMGRNISMPNSVERFVGRKKRKGGGGGGSFHDDGKKKMMMMAMMCMKMKLMMMVPAMMGMMGMMSFKGMIFSMMSFMMSKMMLLMKLLEKKGLGSGGGGSDGGWAASGGGGGTWMPAGGQDYSGVGGYDANGQWQSRSIIEYSRAHTPIKLDTKPVISYKVPTVRYYHYNANNKAMTETREDIINEKNKEIKPKSRKKRGIIDAIHNVYSYWMNQILGSSNRRKSNYPKFKIVNGIKYVYYPTRMIPKLKAPIQTNQFKYIDEGFRPILIGEDFNKGESVEGPVESRMSRRKFHKMKESVNDTVEESPWE